MDNNGMNTEYQNGAQQQMQQSIPDPAQQTQVNYTYNANLEEPLSIGAWLITMLIMLIPCVNLVMIFVWAFSSENKSKQNFFKAYLIAIAIMIVLQILLLILFGASFMALVGKLGNSNFMY